MSASKVLEAMETNAPPMARYVLIFLASHFNDKTGMCFPSVSTLATETGLCEKTIRRSLAELIKAKLISKNHNPGMESSFKIHLKPLTGSGKSDQGTLVFESTHPGLLVPNTLVFESTPIKQKKETIPADLFPEAPPSGNSDESRHHSITSQIGAVYEEAKGSKFSFNGRFAKALKQFLNGWKGTADEWLDRYHDCLRLSTQQFAGKCRSACDPVYLCQNWLSVCAEIDSFDKAAPKPKLSTYKNSL